VLTAFGSGLPAFADRGGGLARQSGKQFPAASTASCSDAQTVSASSVAAANPTWLAVRHSWPLRRSIRPTAASTS
jgi:hypothetical protein